MEGGGGVLREMITAAKESRRYMINEMSFSKFISLTLISMRKIESKI